MKTDYFVVTNRGHLKCFRTFTRDNGRLGLELKEETHFAGAFGRCADKLTDVGGRHRVGASVGGNGGGGVATQIPDLHTMQQEDQKRLLNEIAAKLKTCLGSNGDTWTLAVPTDIKNELLNHIDPKLSNRLKTVITKDLTNMAHEETLKHLQEALTVKKAA